MGKKQEGGGRERERENIHREREQWFPPVGPSFFLPFLSDQWEGNEHHPITQCGNGDWSFACSAFLGIVST